VTGFAWENGKAYRSSFSLERYTIKVVSENERLMTRMVGDTAGRTTPYQCEMPIKPESDPIVCQEQGRARPWLFYRQTYVRSFMAGPPAGDPADPNIWIAYGTCTKF
jgi:hypothetical protein